MTSFFFDGRACAAEAGDTVASALYRAGRRVFSRSFKYHRPRGLLCVAGRCPNCLVNVDGAPNVRACTTPVQPGMRVRHQNAVPSLELDVLSAAQRFGWLMPVGFYYKAMTTARQWRLAEPLIRRVAGLGEVSHRPTAVPDRYEHEFARADVAVIGGGPAGMLGAIAAASGGSQVVLVDDQPGLGGHLRYQRLADPHWLTAGSAGTGPDESGPAAARRLSGRVSALPNIRVLTNASCFGLYEGGLLAIVQRSPLARGPATAHPAPAHERLIHLRADRIVVATGGYEAPLLFENNDVPGVMLSSGVQRLLTLHGIRAGECAVVVSTEPGGGPVADDLRAAGVRVAGVVPPTAVRTVTGRMGVSGLKTTLGDFACDLVVVCGPWVPDAGLVAQAGGTLAWSGAQGAFVPVDLPPGVTAIGGVTGAGAWAPPGAGSALTGASSGSTAPGAVVCYCEDVLAKDISQAVGEGFDHIETLKRYTTVTMGPCQGKMCQLASIGLCARETGRTIATTGVTTSRPPSPAVSLGALAGARHHPVKRTPMHAQHEALGCTWMDMGEWKRPLSYGAGSSDARRRAVEAEYRAVRERVGLIDLSTLGKLDVKGADAGKLLDKVYTNRLSDLRIGRARYSVICDDSGIILDDGTISRLADDHFFITTTTGNLEFVHQWLEWWVPGNGWCVHVTNVTGGYAAVNVAGPNARALLQPLTGCDLRTRAFPYMACRQAEVAGVPCLLLRIGFVGETGWEIHFPAEYGEYLWETLMEAGREHGLRPFGVETQRVLRLEKRHVIVGVDTDATSNPLGADMAWVARLDREDFIGKAAILQAQGRALREKLVGFRMDDDLIPEDGAAILVGGEPLGRVTSARYSFATGKAVGLGWVPAESAAGGQVVQMPVDGRLATARLVDGPFYDPDGKRLRG